MDKFKLAILLNQLHTNPDAITISIIKENLGTTNSYFVKVMLIELYETIKNTKNRSLHSYELENYLFERII